MFGTSINLWFGTTKVLICGVGKRHYHGCKCECCRYNRYNGNVPCFGKAQQGVTFSCSRLTMDIWCRPVDKVCL